MTLKDIAAWLGEKTENALPALCSRLSREGANGSGTLRLLDDGKPLGIILMENGRVCWALSEGLESRLTEILIDKHNLPRGEVEALYRECRSQQKALGQCLVERSLLTSAEFERALMQHTAEAFRRLAKLRPREAEWIPHRRGGYRASHSFSLSRVLARAAALASNVDSDAVERELGPLVAEGGWALAYARGSALPVAVAGEPGFDLDLLLELGRWASGAFDRLHEARLDSRALMARAMGGTLLAVEREGLVALTWSNDPRALARFSGRYARGQHGSL